MGSDDQPRGGALPNSFQTPNFYVDRLLPLLTSDEWKVLSYAVRRIAGFNKQSDRITVSQFEKGAKSQNGTIRDSGTHLTDDTVVKCLRVLVGYRVIERISENDRLNKGVEYGLQLNERLIDWEGLQKRQSERNDPERARNRTAAARAALLAKQTGGGAVAQTGGGAVAQTGGGAVAQTGGGAVAQTPQNPGINPVLNPDSNPSSSSLPVPPPDGVPRSEEEQRYSELRELGATKPAAERWSSSPDAFRIAMTWIAAWPATLKLVKDGKRVVVKKWSWLETCINNDIDAGRDDAELPMDIAAEVVRQEKERRLQTRTPSSPDRSSRKSEGAPNGRADVPAPEGVGVYGQAWKDCLKLLESTLGKGIVESWLEDCTLVELDGQPFLEASSKTAVAWISKKYAWRIGEAVLQATGKRLANPWDYTPQQRKDEPVSAV